MRSEPAQSTRLLWGLAVVGALLFGAFVFVLAYPDFFAFSNVRAGTLLPAFSYLFSVSGMLMAGVFWLTLALLGGALFGRAFLRTGSLSGSAVFGLSLSTAVILFWLLVAHTEYTGLAVLGAREMLTYTLMGLTAFIFIMFLCVLVREILESAFT